MKLKKANAITALAVILFLAGHICVMTFSLWTGWYNYRICKTLPWMALAVLLVHILLSIIIFFFYHDGADTRYKRLNAATMVQRTTAIAMIILIHLHMKAYAHVAAGITLSTGTTVFRIVTELLFFASALAHIAVSCEKACITLGLISTEKSVRTIRICAYFICSMLLLAAGCGAVSFYLKGILS